MPAAFSSLPLSSALTGTIEQLVVVEVDLEEGRAGGDLAGDQRFGERVLDVALQGAAQGTRAVAAVDEGLLENPLLGFLGDRDGDGLLRQVRVELLHQQLDDLDQVGVVERLEEDDLVEAVEELGVEGLLDFVLDQLLDLLADQVVAIALEAEALLLHQVPRADVGGHDEDGVLEVDGVAEAVGQLAIFKDLQQEVEDIGVRLLDFVEQDDRVGRALDAFGQAGRPPRSPRIPEASR